MTGGEGMTNSPVIVTGVRPYRTMALALGLLVVIPFALSVINIQIANTWKIHFFQAAVFLAALRFGVAGGVAAGVSGSLFTAVTLGNPYLIVGNIILGGMTGIIFRKTQRLIPAVLLAYCCQLPWLIVSSYFFVGLPAPFIAGLVAILLLSNMLWASLITLCMKPLERYLH